MESDVGTAAAILEEAERLVRAGWTTGCLARDADGAPVAVQSDAACMFCMEGALWRASLLHLGHDECRGPLRSAVVAVDGVVDPSIPSFNDRRCRSGEHAGNVLKIARERLFEAGGTRVTA